MFSDLLSILEPVIIILSVLLLGVSGTLAFLYKSQSQTKTLKVKWFLPIVGSAICILIVFVSLNNVSASVLQAIQTWQGNPLNYASDSTEQSNSTDLVSDSSAKNAPAAETIIDKSTSGLPIINDSTATNSEVSTTAPTANTTTASSTASTTNTTVSTKGTTVASTTATAASTTATAASTTATAATTTATQTATTSNTSKPVSEESLAKNVQEILEYKDSPYNCDSLIVNNISLKVTNTLFKDWEAFPTWDSGEYATEFSKSNTNKVGIILNFDTLTTIDTIIVPYRIEIYYPDGNIEAGTSGTIEFPAGTYEWGICFMIGSIDIQTIRYYTVGDYLVKIYLLETLASCSVFHIS